MSAVFKRGNAEVEANLTPMIDVTFLLIVFFVLVSRIVEVENVPMELPRPDQPETVRLGDEQRAVINVIPTGGGRASGYRLGSRTFPPGADGLETLADHLAGLYRANPGLRINLRADRATGYEWIEPVLAAVSSAAARVEVAAVVPRVNLVVITEE